MLWWWGVALNGFWQESFPLQPTPDICGKLTRQRIHSGHLNTVVPKVLTRGWPLFFLFQNQAQWILPRGQRLRCLCLRAPGLYLFSLCFASCSLLFSQPAFAPIILNYTGICTMLSISITTKRIIRICGESQQSLRKTWMSFVTITFT